MKRRGALAGLGAMVVAASSLVHGGVATASQGPVDYRGAESRYAGSQIAKHEGVHGSPPAHTYAANTVPGHDVSGWQGDVDWQASARAGAEFVYIKATEGTGFVSDSFAQQYTGSHGAGLIRGAYHFARPDVSSGAAQATFFVDNGGGWTADGRTLPGALDVEYNPYGDACYGKSASDMVDWIADFSRTYQERTGRAPVIYTSTSWWEKCTGNSSAFGRTNPLWLARYAERIGELPAGWPAHTIWQYADSGTFPGDQNSFNGNRSRLSALTTG
ncbi:lysozyme [Prauserella oleivorans]|uniref:Lysozyme n=1 Tax=Prauserella oleivorans TaxID=1478153 RepID=A0ABW5WHK2_9PSEU